MNDLFLHYRFTDRGGKEVFDVYLASDNKRLKNCLGQVRLDPEDFGQARIGTMEEMTLPEMLQYFTDVEESHAMTADGFDDAIIGAGEDCSGAVVIYDREKVIEILMSQDMDRETAEEYYSYNILGTGGSGMPVFQDIAIKR